jgi:signal transduction histidine kinase
MGGRITAASDEGEGTRFAILLPYAVGAELETTTEESG